MKHSLFEQIMYLKIIHKKIGLLDIFLRFPSFLFKKLYIKTKSVLQIYCIAINNYKVVYFPHIYFLHRFIHLLHCTYDNDIIIIFCNISYNIMP